MLVLVPAERVRTDLASSCHHLQFRFDALTYLWINWNSKMGSCELKVSRSLAKVLSTSEMRPKRMIPLARTPNLLFSSRNQFVSLLRLRVTLLTLIALIALGPPSARAQGIEQDSLALVAFYNATNGAMWTNNTNWLTGPLSTWFG